MPCADGCRQPISRAKSLPSLGDPTARKGPSFPSAPRFGRDSCACRSRPQSAQKTQREPSLGRSKQRGYKDQERPTAPVPERPTAPVQERSPPIHELLPSEIGKEVRRVASSGGVVIEMLWGASAYLPAHNGGLKYVDVANRLQGLLHGKLSRGLEIPIHIIDKPIRVKKKPVSGIFDQFSDWERAFDLVASNRSYATGLASRMGAFEVHLIQSNRNPNLCGMSSSTVPTPDDQYHTLLHSKLWTRHWPQLWVLLARIGMLMIREPPDVPKPVLLAPVSFARKPSGILQHCEFSERSSFRISSAVDRRSAVREELLVLMTSAGCSCEQWTVLGEKSKAMVAEALHEHGVSSPCTVTLLWGLDGNPYKSDLDLMTTVDGKKLYFSNKHVGNCKLDFDRNAGGELRKDPAENISLGQAGTFDIEVTNYCNRDDSDVPFKVLVRRSGHVSEAEIYDAVWPKDRQMKDAMKICTVTVSEVDLKVKEIKLERAETRNYTLSKCICGNKLDLYTIIHMLQKHDLSADAFEAFASSHRDEWHGRGLHEFLDLFVQEQQRAEQDDRKEKEDLAQHRFRELREACRAEEKNQIRKDYTDDFERGQAEAERIYVQLCLFLIRKVPNHNLDLSGLQNGEASVQEADKKLKDAIHLNETRKTKLTSWYAEVNSWRGSYWEKEMGVFDAILQQRPDLAAMVSGSEEAEVETLDGEIQRFNERIQQASREHDRQEYYQGCINELTEKFDVQLADSLHELGL